MTITDLAPKCNLCGGQVTNEDFCYGCKEYICSECDVGNCFGNHQAKDHLNPSWEEDDGT